MITAKVTVIGQLGCSAFPIIVDRNAVESSKQIPIRGHIHPVVILHPTRRRPRAETSLILEMKRIRLFYLPEVHGICGIRGSRDDLK